jgi:3-deoxy-manno-octulosonate cytidylyltransferase (CMP-KDO synthetase)
MSFHIVIPARHASSRLPGKPLADINGRPMISHVMDRCREADAERVLVATDDERIADAVGEAEGEAVMTRADHQSGTDRLQEVAEQLQLPDDAIVVNVQGDEPLIPAQVINQVAGNLAANPACSIATLCEPISSRAELFNANVVKVVMDGQGKALYFSRAPIPWHRDSFSTDREGPMPAGQWWRHIGIYAYRVSLLHRFVTWEPAQLEQLESLEQLRAMAHGEAIHVAPAAARVPAGVDTPEDLEAVRRYLGEA